MLITGKNALLFQQNRIWLSHEAVSPSANLTGPTSHGKRALLSYGNLAPMMMCLETPSL